MLTRIIVAALWMFLLSLLLFWAPILGALIAGVVGGKRAGGIGAAVVATFVPGAGGGLLVYALGQTLTGIPVIGVLAGFTVAAALLAHVGPMLLGAVIGGFWAAETK